MWMSEKEIVNMYKNAKYPHAQIKILAEMNLCEKKDIISILKKHGIKPDLDNSKRRRGETIQKVTVPEAVYLALMDHKAILEDKLEHLDFMIEHEDRIRLMLNDELNRIKGFIEKSQIVD